MPLSRPSCPADLPAKNNAIPARKWKELFYQVNGSAKRRYGGVGLGLALVKQIVEAHAGQVKVESQVMVGTTFTVQLPKYNTPDARA